MRRTLAALVVALAAASAAFAQSGAEAAREELNAGERAYRDGRVEEAERRFRRAVELDPAGKETRLLVARALRRRYRSGSITPENLAAGERAAAAYQEVLRLDPGDEEAFKAVVVIYRQMRRDEKVEEWLLRRANDTSLAGEKRAEAFAALALRLWQCSYNITERPSGKKAAEASGGGDEVVYVMPADEGQFVRASRCVTDGLAFSKRALELYPKSLNALAAESKLLHEAIKLSEMENNLVREAELVRRQQEAQEAFEARREEVRREAAARRASSKDEDDDSGGGGDEGDKDAPAPPAG